MVSDVVEWSAWYASWFEVVDESEALTRPRDEDGERPLLVAVPADPRRAKALRRVGFLECVHIEGHYWRRCPKSAGPSWLPRWDEMVRAYLTERDGPGCRYCGATDAITLDHVIPRSRGGPNKPDNLVLACRPCNVDKDDRTPDEWRAGVIFHRRHCKTAEQRAWFDALPDWPAKPKVA